ncbi:hypothetical protein YEEN111655_08345 [Yersinia entomophaga]
MTPEANNAVRSIAKKLLSELRSKDNKSTLRQLLDKYASQVKPFCPGKHEPWMWLNVIVHRVAEGK